MLIFARLASAAEIRVDAVSGREILRSLCVPPSSAGSIYSLGQCVASRVVGPCRRAVDSVPESVQISVPNCYSGGMRPAEVITVTDARSMLPQLLSSLHDDGPDAEPVYIGAHRRAAGVLVSVERFEEMTEELAALRERFARHESIASALGSVMAEGVTPTSAFMQDAQEFIDGRIDDDELTRRAIERHRK